MILYRELSVAISITSVHGMVLVSVLWKAKNKKKEAEKAE